MSGDSFEINRDRTLKMTRAEATRLTRPQAELNAAHAGARSRDRAAQCPEGVRRASAE
jgi:hypothetical protein